MGLAALLCFPLFSWHSGYLDSQHLGGEEKVRRVLPWRPVAPAALGPCRTHAVCFQVPTPSFKGREGIREERQRDEIFDKHLKASSKVSEMSLASLNSTLSSLQLNQMNIYIFITVRILGTGELLCW